jgi:hypothetical protein
MATDKLSANSRAGAELDTHTHDLHPIPELISVTRYGYKSIPISITRGYIRLPATTQGADLEARRSSGGGRVPAGSVWTLEQGRRGDLERRVKKG